MLYAFVNGIALVHSFSVVIDSDVLKEEDRLFQL